MDYGDDITRVDVGGKRIILVGTAHISARSVEVVAQSIAEERPDSVCVEIDEKRLEALRDPSQWEALNLVDLIKKKQMSFLIARLALMAFQKQMSAYTGVRPGSEMLEAVRAAEELGAEVVLADRDIRTTLLRVWRSTPFWRKAMLVQLLIMSLFQKTEVDESELEDLRESQNISEMLDEMGGALPSVKIALVDERDTFMAHQIVTAPGAKVLAVVGAAHKPGILRCLKGAVATDAEIDRISEVPVKSRFSVVLPWLIPVIVIGLFVAGFFFGDPENFQRAFWAWILANGILASLGAIAAFAHPLTVLTAFVAAPITSLNPTVGAGMATSLVQTLVSAPTVRDMERFGDEIGESLWAGLWKNRFGRVLLAFALPNIGSSLGTAVAFGWLKDLVG